MEGTMGAEQERVVREFLKCMEGLMDVEAMTALMTDDFVWQINVPLAKIVSGRDAARAEAERQSTMSTGMLPGSEIRSIASNDHTVFTERVDVVEVGGKRLTVHINGIFEVRDGKIAAWREYFDSTDFALQLGVDAKVLYEAVGT
jgi:limonene-1,2-epoxide hydrolase